MKTISATFVCSLLDLGCASGNRQNNQLYAKMRTAANNIVYPSTKFIDKGGLAKISRNTENKNCILRLKHSYLEFFTSGGI